MSQCSVALLLCIVDLICVGSSVVAQSLVWLSLVDLSVS